MAIYCIVIVIVFIKVVLITSCCIKMANRKNVAQRAHSYSMGNVPGSENGYSNPDSNATTNDAGVVLATRDMSGRPIWSDGGGVYRAQDTQEAYAKVPSMVDEPPPVYTRDG